MNTLTHTAEQIAPCPHCGQAASFPPELWLGYMKFILSEAAPSRPAVSVLPEIAGKKTPGDSPALNTTKPNGTKL